MYVCMYVRMYESSLFNKESEAHGSPCGYFVGVSVSLLLISLFVRNDRLAFA
jgi:hypothetical protein